MKQIECGCEISPGNRILSLCAIHGEHMHVVHETAKHPRAEGIDREYQKALTLALAPNFAEPMADPNTRAEALLQHVQEIMRRLD